MSSGYLELHEASSPGELAAKSALAVLKIATRVGVWAASVTAGIALVLVCDTGIFVAVGAIAVRRCVDGESVAPCGLAASALGINASSRSDRFDPGVLQLSAGFWFSGRLGRRLCFAVSETTRGPSGLRINVHGDFVLEAVPRMYVYTVLTVQVVLKAVAERSLRVVTLRCRGACRSGVRAIVVR